MAPTTFLDLPPELRNAIYAELTNTTPKDIITLRYIDHTTTSKNDHSHDDRLCLLLASKQLHAETLPIFLASHSIRITDTAWPRILSMRPSYLNSIMHLVIGKQSTSSVSKALVNASNLPNLTTLDIRIPNFRFGKAKPYLLKGFPMLRRLCVSEPRLKVMRERLELEDGEEGVEGSSCIYAVEDFQTWREGCEWKAVDRELDKELRDRMAKMVGVKLF